MGRGRIVIIDRKPPKDADGVTYETRASAPGLKLFACAPQRAVLSQQGCGSRWLEAQSARGFAAERLEGCRGCPIGAAHAGERPVVYSKLYGLPICPRCRNERVQEGKVVNRGGLRMIGNRLCVSCYNRNRELKAGRNGRGNRPVELLERTPRVVELRVSVDGRAAHHRYVAVDVQEPMIQTLRTAKGEALFGFSGPTATLRQGRLF